MSTFSGLNIARTGMDVSQKAIDLTGHNIANANTEGYTRQRLSTVSVETGTGLTRLATSLPETGGGVKVIAIDQIRSKFLDGQYRIALSEQEELKARNESLENMEMLFNEMNSTGMSAQLDDFLSGVEEVSKQPSDLGIRTALVQSAMQITDTFNYLSDRLSELQSGLNSEVADTMVQISELEREITDLNERIYRYENSGQSANELRDQLNLKSDELSGLADGKMKGLLIARDGSSAEAPGIAFYSSELDKLAAGIGEAFNAVHEQGWTMPDLSRGIASQMGIPLFVAVDEAEGMTAGNIRVNPEIIENPRLVAASSEEITGNGIYGNNVNALLLSGVFDKQDIEEIGGIRQFITSLVSGIGSEAAGVSSHLSAKSSVAASIEERRQSVSGVSLNEEMANLMKFQQSYNAAARVITAIDESLDVLINRMGIVGR